MGASLAGRCAVVTGASRGIGSAIAALLAAEGAAVAITGRGGAALDGRAAALGPNAFAVVMDVADESSVRQGFERIRGRLPRIDILVNNAGQAASAPLAKTDLALWQRMLDVNLTGTFLCTREVLPPMVAAGWGRVVNIASTAGIAGYAYVSAYTAAKHGVIGLTRSLALEAARSGVTVNAVCPGYTDTELVGEAVANISAKTGRSEAEARATLASANPQGRLVQPEEVAHAVLWLCSAGAAAINGQAIVVAGGEVMAG
jgi:NAD(P)-dependent dehydrogenase (short-subunit alcohol dehydrogenase family)